MTWVTTISLYQGQTEYDPSKYEEEREESENNKVDDSPIDPAQQKDERTA